MATSCFQHTANPLEFKALGNMSDAEIEFVANDLPFALTRIAARTLPSVTNSAAAIVQPVTG